MKIAIVLTGTELANQARELNSFIKCALSQKDDMEAWVLCDREIDLQDVPFSAFLKRVVFIRIKNAFVAENCLDALCQMYRLNQPKLILFGSTAFAGGLSARVSERLGGSSCAGVRATQQEANRFVIEKLVYSNNLVARFALKRTPYCISIAKNVDNSKDVPISKPQIEHVELTSLDETNWLRSHQIEFAQTEDSLRCANIVVAIGQGIGSKEKLSLANELAELLGGKLGASRPVVLNAWLGMEHLIGASGSMIAPDLCIAIGVSGAAAFAVGIEKSKFIIAINRDEKAPIFKIADVGICADYSEIVPELNKILTQSALSEIG